jgi:hypothetical protein
MISAVGVVVPARDEAALIGDCVAHLRGALGALPDGIERAVCVVADRCVDDTAAIARAGFGGWSGTAVLANWCATTVGEVRQLGFRQVLAMLAGYEPSETLLLSTDADTTVAPGWALAHLHLAEQGWHAIAGVAELDEPLPPPTALRYAAERGRAHGPHGHGNVYGANLGVRADAYAAVGGFTPLATGEDHDLWRRLDAAGFRCVHATEAVATTSSRLAGRARDGLAALLNRLQEGAELIEAS